jgi:hypothetical protein
VVAEGGHGKTGPDYNQQSSRKPTKAVHGDKQGGDKASPP